MANLNNWNAFAFLKENTISPHARSLRTSFWGKLSDTFKVLYGQLNVDEGIESAGIFDYLSLAGFFFITRALYWCIDNYSEKKLAIIFLIPTALLSLTGFIARLAVSLALTLALSPLVFIIHQSIELIVARKLKRLAYSLEGADNSTIPFEASKRYCLSNFLKNHHRKSDEMSVSFQKNQAGSSFWGGERKQQTILFKYIHTKESGILTNQQLLFGGVLFIYLMPCLIPFIFPRASKTVAEKFKDYIEREQVDCFEVELNEDDSNQKRQLSALFQLNLSQCLETLNDDTESKERLKNYIA